VDAAAGHVASFAEIMCGLAVVNGLSLPYSSGAVEGTVNRIKTPRHHSSAGSAF
jgi:hypothetical protein